MKLSFLPLAALVTTSAGFAQLPDIAIAAAYANSCNVNDVQTKLIASGRFGSVDIIEVKASTPVLADLTPYDALLTWTNLSYNDAIALGDVFADYVDAGGGVVVATFATSTTTNNRYLAGRWITGGYEVIQTQSGNTASSSSLGTILQPGNPLMNGVTTLNANSAFRPTGTTLVQGSVVAEWADGKILVAEGTMAGRVDLGLFPPSTDCSTAYWDATTDGAVLIANALEVAAGGGLVTANFCDPAFNNSTGLPTVATATLSASATSGVRLEAMQGPPSEFGYFLLGTAAADPGIMLSNGEFCLAVGGMNQFVRYNVAGGVWNSLGQFDATGALQNFVGTSSSGYGFDLPANIPVLNQTIQAGDTWHFQLWHREAAGASNFSNGLSITF